MAEHREITSLYVVTDSETSYDNIGDIDGGLFNEDWLKLHIKSHGSEQLIEKLASMQMQVLKTKYQILNELDNSIPVENIKHIKI